MVLSNNKPWWAFYRLIFRLNELENDAGATNAPAWTRISFFVAVWVYWRLVVASLRKYHVNFSVYVGESMFVHHMIEKIHYLEALRSIPAEKVDAWRAAS